jgi:hypothetical protein
MFTSSLSPRQADRAYARRPRARRPLVEDLEGRQPPSGIVGNHIGVTVNAMIVGQHVGTSVVPAIQGRHIGTSAMIKGGHIGTSAVSPDRAGARVGSHIGTGATSPEIQGTHHGNNVVSLAIPGSHGPRYFL